MNQDKIGNFIKSIRLEKNLTQKEFADELGVTYQAVSKWENGKNVPDIGTMKLISEKFNVNIDDILNGQKQPKKKKNIYSILTVALPILFVLAAILIIELVMNNNSVEFKTMKSNCSDFKVTGIAAYNKEKASISIPTVEFCGTEDKEEYKEIKCKLYEVNNNIRSEVSQCKKGNNMTLVEYLKNVNINVNNYSTICKDKSKSKMLIEIEALNKDNKTITYTIPIELKDDCK